MDDKQAALVALDKSAPANLGGIYYYGGNDVCLDGDFDAPLLRRIADILDPPQPDPRLDEAIALAKRQAERIRSLESQLAAVERRGPPVGYVHDDGYRFMPLDVFAAWSERYATPEIAAEWSLVGRMAV